MKKREFNKILSSITVDKKLSIELLQELSNDVKNKLICYIVSKREPVLVNFINEDTDIRWLHSMGYMYRQHGSEYDFITHGG